MTEEDTIAFSPMGDSKITASPLLSEPIRAEAIMIVLQVRIIVPSGLRITNWVDSFIAQAGFGVRDEWGEESPWVSLLFNTHFLSPTPPVGPIDVLRERAISYGKGTDNPLKGIGSVSLFVDTQGWRGGGLGGAAIIKTLGDKGTDVWSEVWQPMGPTPGTRNERKIPVELVY